MKIVLDTNVVLSALISKRGASNLLLRWLFQSDKKYAVVSNTLVTEYEDVLTRRSSMVQFNDLSREDVLRFVDDICLIAHHQAIHFRWRPFLPDEKDDMVLEVAVNANVDGIVTFNPKDFQGVEALFDIKVLTPQAYLKRVGVLT